MTSPVLSLQDATYHVKGRPLVSSASLDLAPGRVTVVIGPNGAGKSTLLRLLSGELRPTHGAAFGLGERLETVAPWRLACLRTVMTQNAEVAFAFSGREVVELGLEALGRATSAPARAQAVERCLFVADALDFSRQSYAHLSGGEKRRIQFARALAQLQAGRSVAPRQALLLDEPVASLDLRHQLTLLDEARRLASEGVAVLAVLHDFNLAARYADVLAVMSAGRLVACGDKDGLLDGPLLSEVFGVELSVRAQVEARDALILPAGWLKRREG